MRTLIVVAVLGFGSGCQQQSGPLAMPKATTPPAYQPPTEPEVALKVVKWPELETAIAAQKGNIVVIDVWADYCGPCKEKFPHFVELHEKYHRNGVVCISVTVDDKDDAMRCLDFLKKKKATFANYLIDEPGEVWEPKLDSGPPPTVIVLDRQGKRAKRFTTEQPFTYLDVEKAVVAVIAGK